MSGFEIEYNRKFHSNKKFGGKMLRAFAQVTTQVVGRRSVRYVVCFKTVIIFEQYE